MTTHRTGQLAVLGTAALLFAGCASSAPVGSASATRPAGVGISGPVGVGATKKAAIVKQVERTCQDISVTDLLREYRRGGDEIVMAHISAVDEPKRVALADGDLVYSRVEFIGVSAVFGPIATVTSPALSLGGTAGDLTVVTERPSGLVRGQRAVLVLGRTPGVGETVSNAYLVTGGSVILDGVCQQPGDLPTTPAGAAAKKLVSTPETVAAGPSDPAVAVDLQAFLAVARA